MTTIIEPDVYAKNFNSGCDARLRGDAMHLNPFVGDDDSVPTMNALAWRSGWRDVNANWGTESTRPVKRLGDVKDFSINYASEDD